MAPSIYDFPEIYATLMNPEPELLRDMFSWIETHLEGGEFASVIDPCCGPATWLLPFAVRGLRVAGNDLGPAMIEEAGKRLEAWGDAELTVGDMRAPPLRSGPFDVGVNVHASVGHLPDDEAIAEHLDAMAELIRPGGLYLLGCVINDGESLETEAEDLYESDPLHLPSGGIAACHYRSIRRDHAAGCETIEVRVLTHEAPGIPDSFTDTYELRTHHPRELTRLLDANGAFEVCAIHSMLDETRKAVALGPQLRDVTLILRRL